MRKNSNKVVLLVHGFEGTPNGSWRPWLMRELEKVGIYTAALAFPSPNKPELADWMSVLNYNVKLFPKSKIYLVGHSLGVPAILQYLQKYKPKNVECCILVSGPIKNEKKAIKSFFDKKIDYKKIKVLSKRFLVVHGDNDRFVPYKQATILSEELASPLVTIKEGGHLNEYNGCLELPVVLEGIVR